MCEPVARARHTETEALFDVVVSGRGGLEAAPAPASADSTFIGNVPPSAIDPAIAGAWRHFKGGVYEFITLVAGPEGTLVLYRDGRGGSWLRPEAMVHELVERDGERNPRFVRVKD